MAQSLPNFAEKMTTLTPDDFKRLLRIIYPCKTDFSVRISHKRTRRVLGSYYLLSHRINIYDYRQDNTECTKTAIHEYAHHLHYTEYGKVQLRQRTHGKEFWQIYGWLMKYAIDKGIFH